MITVTMDTDAVSLTNAHELLSLRAGEEYTLSDNAAIRLIERNQATFVKGE